MRLVRLLLHAVGPFTEREIDFGHCPAGLHLVYGPNEAGKSSALRAMMDLRFGFPARPGDQFIHANPNLRIGGVFVGEDDAELGLWRRKGQKGTLTQFVPGSEAEHDPRAGEAADPRIEARLTGGLSRVEFELMHGLDHQRLRAGGENLVRGEGELGAALFEASAGLEGVGAVLEGLEQAAKDLYNPAARKRGGKINQAAAELRRARDARKAAQTLPRDWKALAAAHARAEETYERAARELEDLRRNESQLTELFGAAPVLARLARSRTELADLADVPELAPDASQRRLLAYQSHQEAAVREAEAEQRLEACSAKLSELAQAAEDPVVLAEAEAIERLVQRCETLEAEQRALADARLEAESTLQRMTLASGVIAQGVATQTLLAGRPSQADRALLSGELDAWERANTRREVTRERVAGIEKLLSEAARADVAVDEAGHRNLRRALDEARGLGPVADELVRWREAIADGQRVLGLGLVELGFDEVAGLEACVVCSREVIDTARGSAAQALERVTRADQELARLERTLAEEQVGERGLLAGGELATMDSVADAREARDAIWAKVRARLVQDPAGLAYDPQALVDEFETAQHHLDREVELLLAGAQRSALLGASRRRIDELERQCQAARTARVQAQTDAERERGEWQDQLVAAGLPPVEPDALLEWQHRREAVLLSAQQQAAAERSLAELAQRGARASAALAAALAALDAEPSTISPHPDEDFDLGTFLARMRAAEETDQALTQAAAAERERANTRADRHAELQRLREAQRENKAEIASRREHMTPWCERLALPNTAAPDMIRARLAELDDLGDLHAQWHRQRVAKDKHQGFVDQVRAEGARLAEVLGESPPRDPRELATRAARRLRQAREIDADRRELERERRTLHRERERARQDGVTQRQVLAELSEAAGVDTPEQLPDLELRSARRRELRLQIAQDERDLARPEAVLRERLAESDRASVQRMLDECRANIERADAEVVACREAAAAAKRELDAVDGSDRAVAAAEAVNAAAAGFRSALVPWARVRLAHALLEQTLARFRERAQGPMLERAGSYFSLMTRGRYPRLAVDYLDEVPTLRAPRADGTEIGVEAMSEGTRDQLYLALRLASLEMRREAHPHIPLVLDDVLVTSDDERAASMFAALERFAIEGQVIVFTHHRHLIEVARGAVGHGGCSVHHL